MHFILVVVIFHRILTPYVVVCPPKIEGFDRYKNGDHQWIGFHLFSKKTPIYSWSLARTYWWGGIEGQIVGATSHPKFTSNDGRCQHSWRLALNEGWIQKNSWCKGGSNETMHSRKWISGHKELNLLDNTKKIKKQTSSLQCFHPRLEAWN